MGATLVTVTGTVPTISTAPNPILSFSVSTPITNGSAVYTMNPIVVQASSSGAFSVVLPANDDAATSPSGSYYRVLVTAGSTKITDINVVVQSALAPTTTLNALPIVLPSSTGGTKSFTSGTVVIKKGISETPVPIAFVDPTAGAFTTMLQSAATFWAGRYTIRNISVSTTNVVTVKTLVAGQTIDGSASTTVGASGSGAAWVSLDLVSDGSNWRSV